MTAVGNRRNWFFVLLALSIIILVALIVRGQYPPGTPPVSQCAVLTTDRDRTTSDVLLSPSSYFVRVGAKPVALHLEFTAYSAKGLQPQYALVAVVSKSSGVSASARPSLVAQDRYAVDLPLIGLTQPYFVLISFKSQGLWVEATPRC